MMEFRTLLLTAAAAVAVALPAQEPQPAKPPTATAPAQKKSVEQLIEALGNDSYRARLDAERSLRELGQEAVPQLQKAAAEAADAEVQWRAKRVLRQIERGSSGDLQQRTRPQGEPEAGDTTPPGLRRRTAERDAMKDQFESLFERFERDFGMDIPRARFFNDDFFRDLQEQMKAGAGRSQGMSMQIGPDGAVRVEVQEKGEDGKTDTKVYEAPDMESFQQKYPGVLQKNGLGMGLFPGGVWRLPGMQGVPGWQFEVEPTPRLFVQPRRSGQWQRQPGTDVQPDEAPAPPPAGRRLGISIEPEIPAAVREYLGLDEGQGLMVEGVQEGSLAQSLGLQKGDIVTRIGEHAIGSPQDVQEALAPLKKGEQVEVHFVRKGAEKTAKAAKTEDSEPGSGEKKAAPLQRRSGRSDEAIR